MAEEASTNQSRVGVFSLTQIRHLMRVEFGRAQRYGYPVSCMALACDRLENLRDLYGYEFRETVVDSVVDLFRNQTRGCDYLGRLMNDRLLGILPHTTREGAEASAQRILEAARGLAFRPEGNVLRVTLSIGISQYENDNTLFFDSLLDAAEDAMVAASDAGGDRIAFRAPGPGTGGEAG